MKSLDSDPEVFAAFLKTPPRILVKDVGEFATRDFGKLSSMVWNLNPAIREYVGQIASQTRVEDRYDKRSELLKKRTSFVKATLLDQQLRRDRRNTKHWSIDVEHKEEAASKTELKHKAPPKKSCSFVKAHPLQEERVQEEQEMQQEVEAKPERNEAKQQMQADLQKEAAKAQVLMEELQRKEVELQRKEAELQIKEAQMKVDLQKKEAEAH